MVAAWSLWVDEQCDPYLRQSNGGCADNVTKMMLSLAGKSSIYSSYATYTAHASTVILILLGSTPNVAAKRRFASAIDNAASSDGWGMESASSLLLEGEWSAMTSGSGESATVAIGGNLSPAPAPTWLTGSFASGIYRETQTPRPIGILCPAFFRAS